MSGMGGGGGGWAIAEAVACERLQFETDVRSPNPAVIGFLAVGDVLNVSLDGTPAQAVVLSYNGALVGGMVSPQVPRLRECINAGTTYRATVIAKPASNIVSVRVTPSRR
jgi:hypothetical protein